MNQTENTSITYDAPPLVEVAMSVQFDPPAGLNQAHLGAFWVTQKDSLPHVRALEPIATTNEAFGNPSQWLPPSWQLELTREPDCRLQMRSLDDQWMCQLQRNRLVINWRKRSDNYPRFGATRDRFCAAWKSWQMFLGELNLPRPRPRLWELTYVNRVPEGSLWKAPDDWPNVFPGLWGGRFATVPGAQLRGHQGRWVWESSHPPARLYVEPKPGHSADAPPQAVLLLSLTARGPLDPFGADPKASDGDDDGSIEAGIAFGHELIVGTFDRITSETARKEWGRHADSD